jgi:hypothetical protein
VRLAGLTNQIRTVAVRIRFSGHSGSLWEESFKYDDWFLEQNFLMYSAVPLLAKSLESYK